jgi:hypothetical protein
MRVKIRLNHGPQLRPKNRKNQHVALALASLLTPVAVTACVMAFWRLVADFKSTGAFPISSGLFSHWQVWLAGAAVLQIGSILLNRYGNSQSVLRKSVNEPEEQLVNTGSSN